MTKAFSDLYPKIYDPSNLWSAFKQAARGKRSQPAVASFEFNLEAELIRLENELKDQVYQPGRYRNFVILSPKRRLISAAPFRDRVVHHALMNVIEPLFDRQFIFDSYANRKGKGTHRALDRCTQFLRKMRFVMHLDVRQFFPSIDHQILKSILSRTIADQDVLDLVAKILRSGEGVQEEEYEMVYFPGDDLFAIQRWRGLPIGNLTSQHWANVYLNELDQFAKRVLKIPHYIRYVDDILLFSNDKRVLSEWRGAMIHFLYRLRLTIHEQRAQPRPAETGVSFLGFIIFPAHRRLKRRNGVAFQRRLKRMVKCLRCGEMEQGEFYASIQGWINHARYGDTFGLRRSMLNTVGILGCETNE